MHPPDLPLSRSLGEQTGTAPEPAPGRTASKRRPAGLPWGGGGGPPGAEAGAWGPRGPYWGGGWCPGALGLGGGESASEEQSEET